MATLASIDGGSGEDSLWDGFSRFVPRLSWKDGFLLKDLPNDQRTSVAKSLAQAAGDAQLVLAAHRVARRTVILDPEAWRNQQPPEQRSAVFTRMGGPVSLAGALDPAELSNFSTASLVRYALAVASAEHARGADTVLSPSHLAGGHGSAGRDGELRLAAAASAIYRREGVDRRDAPKPLLIGIAVQAADILTSQHAVALARSYSGLDADGFWAQFAGLSEAAPADLVSRCAEFLYALQSLSGKRVFAVDVKNLVWPLLAGGLYGGCIGVGERESWDGPAAASNERRPIKPTVVHPELMRSFVASGPIARRAFAEFPCECDAHPPDQPPLTKPDIRRHALRVRLIMADEATSATGAVIVESWLSEATWAAADLGLEQPPVAAFRAALAAPESWRQAA